MKRNVLGGILLLAGAAGCVSIGNQRLEDKAAVDKVQIGKSRDDVRAALGEPNGVTEMSTGQEIWVYTFTRSRATAASYIPIIGLFAGGADGHTSTLDVTFSTNGLVDNMSKGQHTSKVRY